MICSLKNRRALITGAGAGLGRGIAVAMAEAGADCVAWARREHLASETADLVRQTGRQAHAAGFELQDDTALEQAWHEASEALGGPIDIVVHNAAVMPVAPIQICLCTSLIYV